MTQYSPLYLATQRGIRLHVSKRDQLLGTVELKHASGGPGNLHQMVGRIGGKFLARDRALHCLKGMQSDRKDIITRRFS